jgi:putative spermidine/putrescine transport system permease protein
VLPFLVSCTHRCSGQGCTETFLLRFHDEIARPSQAVGALNTLPLALHAVQTNATTPVIYALSTLTTALSLGVIACCLLVMVTIQHRRPR